MTDRAAPGLRPILPVLLPALLAPPALALAVAIGGQAGLPILATAAVYPLMAHLVLRGRVAAAVVAVLLWALTLSASIIALSALSPGSAAGLVFHGAAYRDEMFRYIREGYGRESDPALFVPQHLLHLAGFVVLSLISGGLLGILMGAILVGYMSYYVGALVGAGGAPLTAWLLGWPPWAILRMVAFVMLGVALSRPLLLAMSRRQASFGDWRSLYVAAAALLLSDVVLKALLAPAWAGLLRPCLGAP